MGYALVPDKGLRRLITYIYFEKVPFVYIGYEYQVYVQSK